MNELNFTYLVQPPSKYTFEMKKVRLWVESWCKGSVLNLFAGKTKLSVRETRVDLENEFNPDYCMDAYAFILKCRKDKVKFDTILLDPPYNLRKTREKYHGNYIGSLTKIKNQLIYILNTQGRIISLGYDSTGMSKSRGFQKKAICLVCHKGDHNDTIILVEESLR